MNWSMPGFHVHHQLLELVHTHVHWVSDAIQPSHPLCPLLLLPLIFPSSTVFSNESVLRIRWPKYWSFSLSISLSNDKRSYWRIFRLIKSVLSGVWLCDPEDCSPPGSSVYGISQARIREWIAISSSRGSSWPRDQTSISWGSCFGRQILCHWATWGLTD